MIDAKDPGGFFSNYINTGDFDIAYFGWVGDAFPLSGLTQIYASYGESNFGKIGNEPDRREDRADARRTRRRGPRADWPTRST